MTYQAGTFVVGISAGPTDLVLAYFSSYIVSIYRLSCCNGQ